MKSKYFPKHDTTEGLPYSRCHIEGYGTCRFRFYATSRKISCRWKSGELNICVPERLTCGELDIFLDTAGEKILAMKDRSLHSWQIGDEVEMYDGRKLIFINTDNALPNAVNITKLKDSNWGINFHVSADPGDPAFEKPINNVVKRLLLYEAPRMLLPDAMKIAGELEVKVRDWETFWGKQRLGRCSARNVIGLSGILCLYPPELVRYIVCHELAHTYEHNHSAKFHAIVDKFTGGKEKELERKLKTFKIPFNF